MNSMLTSYLQRFWPVFLFGIVMSVLTIVLPGTGDDGDSVHHYLFARYAYVHPGNFFDHWAKPLYVLMMAPFAQFGFWGVKLVNVGLMTLTLWCTMRIAEHMDMRRPWLVGFIICTMPELLHLTLSGLTEPLFAACLALGTLWFFEEKNMQAALLLSFLPFVRSEGLIVLGVIGVYMLLSGKWRLVPLLATGHIVYGLAGWPVFGSPLWVFSKIPYATLNGHYGKGHWSHFFSSARYYWGFLVSMLVWIGLAIGIGRWLGYARGKNIFDKKELWLIYGVFAAYFASHVVFWGLGIFNSFGLTRVMIGIACMTAIIAARAGGWILDKISQPRLQGMATGLLVAGLLYSMWDSPKFLRKFGLSPFQKSHNELAEKYKNLLTDKGYIIYSDAVNIGYALDMDWFGAKRHYSPTLPAQGPFEGPVAVIWDFWYSVVESSTTLEQLQNDPRLKMIEVFRAKGDWPEPVTVLFMDTAHAVPTPILYYQNFETLQGNNIEKDFGRISKQSLKINKSAAYGPSYKLNVKDVGLNDSIQISFEVLLNDTSNWEPRVVVQYSSDTGSMLKWKGYSINQSPQRTSLDWFLYQLVVPIQKDSFPNSTLEIYPWNNNEKTIWMDNMEIRFLSKF